MKAWAEIMFIVIALVFGAISGYIIGKQKGEFFCINQEVDRIIERLDVKLRLGIGGRE
jgi:hypothetical protein